MFLKLWLEGNINNAWRTAYRQRLCENQNETANVVREEKKETLTVTRETKSAN